MYASTCNLELRITSAAIHEAIITIIHGTVLKRSSHVHKVVHTIIWTDDTDSASIIDLPVFYVDSD